MELDPASPVGYVPNAVEQHFETVIREKEDRPEAADHSRSKMRNQRWIDFLRSTGTFPCSLHFNSPSCAKTRPF